MNALIRSLSALCLGTASLACGTDDPALTYRSDVSPVTRVEDAQPGVFVPPFLDCRPEGSEEICTHVSIAGATRPGKSFSDFAACDVVRSQRPYFPLPPARVTEPSDPRATDSEFMGELAWARQEIAATGCACCHAGSKTPSGASQWDIEAEPIWIDTLSDSGLALFAGYADSSVLGAYPADDNHGFDRTTIGIPSTDTARMKRLLDRVLEQRGISEDDARSVPPFGGPIYENSVRPAEPCEAGEGIDADGVVWFNGGSARYVYVLEQGSSNPGVPPNLDRPEGTIWRLDVLASAAPVETGFQYGTTPAGSFQDTPPTSPAPTLQKGTTYQLTVLRDVGLPVANCVFTFGEPVASPASERPPTNDRPVPAGASCGADSDCTGSADYCAIFPGSTEGYCTFTGCIETPDVCPARWDCFDLSTFQEGAPAFCVDPSQ